MSLDLQQLYWKRIMTKIDITVFLHVSWIYPTFPINCPYSIILKKKKHFIVYFILLNNTNSGLAASFFITVNPFILSNTADRTRVKLKKIGDIIGSDYINANFVDVSVLPFQIFNYHPVFFFFFFWSNQNFCIKWFITFIKPYFSNYNIVLAHSIWIYNYIITASNK